MPAPSSLALYLSLRSALVNYASGIVGDRAQAEDVVQEAYIRFTTADATPIAHPASYLYRIVRNVALDWVRRPAPESLSSMPDQAEGVAHDAPTAEHVVLYRDELRILGEALAELPERTRRAFTLYRLDGLTLQQVADRLGISVVRAHQLVREAILHGSRRLDAPDR